MIDLVVWSFVFALTPVALLLAWRLISWAGDVLVHGSRRAPPRTGHARG
jgi:hypothetical protein